MSQFLDRDTPVTVLVHRRVWFLALLALAACGGAEEKKAPARPTPVVGVEAARVGPVPVTVTGSGVVEASRSAAVVAQVTGLITRVAFREGDQVKAGQPLFTIEPRPFAAALDQARGQAARGQAQLARAKADVERYRGLAKDGYATKEQLEQLETALAAAEAQAEADRATVRRAQFDLDNTVIRAPLSGRTGALLLREGSVARALAEPLVTINELSPVLVRFAVPERDFTEIRRYAGPAVMAAGRSGPTLKALVTPRAAYAPPGDNPLMGSGEIPAAVGDTAMSVPVGGGAGRMGELAFVNNAVDSTTGAVTLKVRVPNTDAAFWPGQFASVSLTLAVDSAAVTVPAQAVQQGQGGLFVFVVDESGAARRRLVQVGRSLESRTVIADGVAPGDRVVLDGHARLVDGGKVEIRGSGARGGGSRPTVGAGRPSAGKPGGSQ
ncbi:MAG: efflux RND transporter periplasmic adaptor subunit [Gemmatimonadaceae bacterium]|jgi:multidrug efflux system membrane fusion protein|nr:efflux RND transporter periplasmic adaptor subunit [Gemmatimonadaceae bacterium]